MTQKLRARIRRVAPTVAASLCRPSRERTHAGPAGDHAALRDAANPVCGIDAMVCAQSDCLALLVTLLDRENVISAAALSRAFTEFASIAAAHRAKQGRVLMLWAARLQDMAVTLSDDSPLR